MPSKIDAKLAGGENRKVEKLVKRLYEEAPFPNVLARSSDRKKQIANGSDYFKMVLRHLNFSPVPAPRRILVAGCGTGEDIAYLSVLFPKAHFTGWDLSRASINQARLNLSYLKKRVKLHVGSFFDRMPISDQSFDMVFSSGVLHHLEDPHAGLGVLAKKAKHGAPIIISLYNSFGFWRINWRRAIIRLFVSDNEDFTKKANLAVKFGFISADDKAQLFDGYAHPRVLTLTLGEIKPWLQPLGLALEQTFPAYDLGAWLSLAKELVRYPTRNPGLSRLLAALLSPFPGTTESGGTRRSPKDMGTIRYMFFSTLMILTGKAEQFFLLKKIN